LSAFFYGRAFATTLTKYLSEVSRLCCRTGEPGCTTVHVCLIDPCTLISHVPSTLHLRSQAVVDLVAEVSKAAAERPQRIREFQVRI
jgi:hypothetical protein